MIDWYKLYWDYFGIICGITIILFISDIILILLQNTYDWYLFVICMIALTLTQIIRYKGLQA